MWVVQGEELRDICFFLFFVYFLVIVSDLNPSFQSTRLEVRANSKYTPDHVWGRHYVHVLQILRTDHDIVIVDLDVSFIELFLHVWLQYPFQTVLTSTFS